MKTLTIAIDFDGTLTKNNTFPEIGEPRLWMLKQAIAWRNAGHKLILWTCREDVVNDDYNFTKRLYLTEAVNWCKSHGLEFDAVNKNVIEVVYPHVKTSRKINADVFVDDKAATFNDDGEIITLSSNNYINL